MASLPYIFLDNKKHLDLPPSFYIRSDNTRYSKNPPNRVDLPKEEDISAILQVNNIDMASLVPKVQFWKVYTDDKGKITKEVYIPYSYSAKNYVAGIFDNRNYRGDDVGIKSVSFAYDNQNPAVAETLLGCTIEMVFDNAEAITIQRNSGFRYLDLFAFDRKDNKGASDKVDRGKYDIILKVGYELDGISETVSHEVRDALKRQERMVRLGMVGYDLVFNPNGMINVSIEYKSANVDYFSDNRNEILGLKTLLGAGDPNPQDQTGSDTRDSVDVEALYGGIQRYMAENCTMFKFDASVVDDILKGDYFFSQNPCVSSGQTADYKEEMSGELIKLKSGDPETLSDILPVKYNGKRVVTYFFLGDLLDAVLGSNPEVYEQMKSRRFAFLLDNVAYQFIKGNQISVFNISKLPIAQSSFDEWFQKNIIDKDQKIYSLMDFMKNITQNFLTGILNTRTDQQVGADYKPNLVRQLLTVPNGLEDNKSTSGFTEFRPVKGITSYAKNATDSYYEYYTIYDEKYYSDIMSVETERIEDSDRYFYNVVSGIPHFYIGANKGLLKEFSFQKSNIGEGIAIIRNLEEGNPFQQLWTIFDVSLEFIGNNLMSVGKTIYLDPSITGLGSPFKKGTVANLMGLGGYYLVTSVNHNYIPKWTTSVQAVSIVPASQQDTYSSDQIETAFVYF
tara:strand:- start:2201 stop:4231 length:2031 start_codon:yes stop_codon:yes gene_type:complete